MNNTVLSICIITYNQERFITQVIESALSQELDFTYEIVIGDDCSNDGTSLICQQYLVRFPEKIKYFRNALNIGMLGNWKETIQKCNGKYIALCEGDDYWINHKKLKKQVDFLENNLSFSLCFHSVYLLEDDKELTLSNLNKCENELTYTIKDLAKQNFIHTPSVVFRNTLKLKFPSWFVQSPVADYIVYMLKASQGSIKYFPEPMAVYRINSGIWSTQTRILTVKKWLKVLNFLMSEDFEEEVILTLRSQWRHIANEYLTLLQNDNLNTFFEEVLVLTKVDADLSYTWLQINTNSLKNIIDSKSYKLSRRISHYKNLIIK